MSFDNSTVSQLRRLVRNMIDNSDNELIQEILEKSFGPATTEPMAKEIPNQTRNDIT
jgi:hypothetical protein